MHEHQDKPHEVQYRFCPRCGHPLASRKLKEHEPERLICRGCDFIFFLDPKVAVGTILPLDGGVVLLKRGIHPGYGRWVFPGGFVDRGEAVEEAAIREAREEANLEIRIGRLLNVYSSPGNPVILLVYVSEVVGGELQARDECLEARVFRLGEIPWEELAFPSTAGALREFLAGLQD
ncbi:MAG: NUDIX hydrolase [candidate division NC10 bacterium]|nr:NUDIX hydrolase [candidate division NC10 bacterium]